MSRKYVVTGAASGIGLATTQLLEGQGHTVLTADLKGADINVDLASKSGRAELAEHARDLSGGRIDGIIAVAGLAAPIPTTVSVNYFGMVATLEGLRPLLEGSDSPRAVGVASFSATSPTDDDLMLALANDEEEAARARSAILASDPYGTGQLIYRSSKKAFAQWVRRASITSRWAGAGIPLNAIAPGVVETPMLREALASAEGREAIAARVPMPLNGFSDAAVPAKLLAWLASDENSHLCGQIIFVDGGSDAATRGADAW